MFFDDCGEEGRSVTQFTLPPSSGRILVEGGDDIALSNFQFNGALEITIQNYPDSTRAYKLKGEYL